MKLSPPTPEVQYLPAIFRRIQTGDIRIPAFQREFVWKEEQVLELMESLYKGFPIGSVLFWRVERKLLQVARAEISSFPDVSEQYPLSYILDGLQRLSALYGCFHWRAISKPNIFNVLFDLDNEEFRHFDNQDLPENYIHLSSIFTPKTFLEAQSRLMKASNADKLLDRAVNLHATFQEYLIPTVTISERSVSEVVSIFERINSTGTKLAAVDFLRAVTWSEEFDLNNAIDTIYQLAEAEGFQIPDEAIVKILAITLHKDPTPDAMLELRDCRPNELHDAVRKAKDSLSQTLRFLKDRYQIFSYDFIPYEGQLLVLVKYTQESGLSFIANIDEVMQWFWTTSLNEGLRGKPDGYVIRALNAVNDLITGQISTLSSRVAITADDLIERRFIQRKALSSAIANIFAVIRARSLFTGEVIDPQVFMTEFSSRNYEGILDINQIREALGTRIQSNKLMANIILVSRSEGRILKNTSAIDVIKEAVHKFGGDSKEILESQMIPFDSLDNLFSGDYSTFVRTRAEFMIKKAKEITNQEGLSI